MKISEIIFEYGRGVVSLSKRAIGYAPKILQLGGTIDRFADRLGAIPITLTNSYFSASKDHLLAGRAEEEARWAWPEEEWPTVYKEIPADIRRPVVWDGRLLGGIDVTWLANKHLTNEILTGFSSAAMRVALKLWLAAVVALSLFYAWDHTAMLTLPWKVSGAAFPSWALHTNPSVVAMYITAAFVNSLCNIVGFAFYAVLMPIKTGLLLLPIAFCVYVAGFTWNLRGWWEDASDAFRTPTRDAMLIWKSRADHRSNEYRAYCRQVDQAIGRLKAQPVIKVGSGTGLLRSRGDMQAPATGQLMAFDGESLRQHLLVLGGTGEGKTRLVLKPLFMRIMTADWGDQTIGCYVCDGKNTLWKTLAPALTAAGRDVKIIGTGEGHFGVNLVAGMSPLDVATTFKAVSMQVLGGQGDDFWPESASLLIMHSAILAKAVNEDPKVMAEFTRMGFQPFSLAGIARISVDEKVQAKVLEALEAKSADEDYQFSSAELAAIDSVEFMRNTWADLAIQTKSGIVANVNSLLGKLIGAPEISNLFCSGIGENVVDVDHALNGGCVMVALGDEGGSASKLATVWLKSRLFVLAKKRLLEDPEAAASNSTLLLVDEAQELITTGADSEATFMNIARETGVFMVYATQSVAALEKAMPADDLANMLNLFRSKIILKTEEAKTIDLQQKLAGTLPRGWETEEHFFATQGLREFMKPDTPAPAPIVKWWRSFFLIGNWNPLPLTIAYKAGVRTTIKKMNVAKWQSPIKRAENVKSWQAGSMDKEISTAMLASLSWRPVIETSEFLVGAGMAFATIQRAGLSRADLIDLVEEEDA